MSPTFGWKAGPEQYGPNELLDYAVAAEAAGFTSLDVSDHFHPWDPRGQAPFTWAWLGAAAVKTQKIELGTGLTCPILRYHPAVVAQAAATLAVMAPGRFYLGVGTGEALNEYAATGDWPPYNTRQAMLAEAITLMRELWTGEPVTFAGDFYETHKAQLFTLPEQPIPIYVSSIAPGSADFAGEYGDGLLTVGGQEPEVYREILQNFEAAAKKAGKEAKTLPRLVELNVYLGDDIPAAVGAFQKYWAGSFVPALFDQNIYTPADSAKNGKVVGADVIEKMGCFAPDPAAHVAFARQYLELGFDRLYFHSAGPDQGAFIERYGREVLPKLG
jgi:coenzyme F420-dependent glucose-6-phosphate dehydrogenase